MKGDIKTPPSEMFQDIVCDSGSSSMDCELCGRTHFCTGGGSFEDDAEIEKYRKYAEQKPEQYCEDSDSDGLSFGTINGMQVVYGCPCNKLRKYEDFIWEDRERIIKYIRRRTEKELESSKKTAEILAGL